MLIEISSNLDFSDLNKNYNLAIENLASAAREGNHAIIADLIVLETLSTWGELGASARALFKSLIRKWPQFPSLESLVSKKIVVGDFDAIHKVTKPTGVEIHIPIAMFETRSLSQKTKLILEDVSDESVYLLIVNWFLAKRKSIASGNPYTFSSVHGGGQRTAFVYKQLTRTETCLTLCIVDTDKKYPNCQFGETARLVQEAHTENNYLNQAFYLEAQEIENLIPISIYQAIYDRNITNSAIKRSYENLELLEAHGALKYFDIKKGVNCKQLNLSSINHNLREYWIPLAEVTNSENDCNYKSCGENNCKKHVIKNWPELKATRNYIETLNESHQYNFNVTPWISSEWERIGQKILNWCLRYDPMIT